MFTKLPKYVESSKENIYFRRINGVWPAIFLSSRAVFSLKLRTQDICTFPLCGSPYRSRLAAQCFRAPFSICQNQFFYENIWIYVINIRPSSFLQSGYGKHLFKCIIITMFCIDHTWWKNVPTVYRFTYIQPNILRTYISPKFILFV